MDWSVDEKKWGIDIELGLEQIEVRLGEGWNEGMRGELDDGKVQHIYVSITDINSGEVYEGRLFRVR